MDAPTLPDETLADVLRARARRTSQDRLVIDLVGGLLVGGVASWARPLGWFPLILAAACFACYGAWALAERRARAEHADGAWRLVARAVGVLGIAAFVLLLFALLGVALGPIKS